MACGRPAVFLLGFAVSIIAGCSSKPADRDPAPAGWHRVKIADCCSVWLPPGAELRTVAEPVDDFSMTLTGAGFSGTVTVTQMGSGLPVTGPETNLTSETVRIDGRAGQVAEYAPRGSEAAGERRVLLWTFDGRNDGTGKNLIINTACDPKACDQFGSIIRTLRRIDR